MQIRLINQRGRVIEVDEQEAQKLIRQGFLLAPNGVKSYSQIYDKGVAEEPVVVAEKVAEVEEVADLLEVTKV